MNNLSLCVTAYNESKRGNFAWIRECLAPAVDNPMVSEIVITNDGTPDFPDLQAAVAGTPKLRLIQNASNLQVFGNKLKSVYQATGEWVLLCDSDNIMRADYYDRLAALGEWDRDTWYCASQAKPTFDYWPFIGRHALADYPNLVPRDPSMFWCFVNTGNQLVHRETFLSIFGHLRGTRFDHAQPFYFNRKDRDDPKWLLAYGANDSFYMMKEWLLAGKIVHCVDGLEYAHRTGIGDQSNYDRGPVEKMAISPAYYLEMVQRIQNNPTLFTYSKMIPQGCEFLQKNGRKATVGMSTGRVEVHK